MGWYLQRLLPNVTYTEEKHILTKEENLIGRSKEADVNCISIHVSRAHAKIVFKNDTPFIKDLGSSNGTYVNKSLIKVEKECRLVNGDTVGFGYAELKDDNGCYVYRIFKESESDEESSSRTIFSGLGRAESPQPEPTSPVAQSGCSSSPTTAYKAGVKRRIEIIDIDLSDDEIPIKKEKLVLNEPEPCSSRIRKDSPQTSTNSSDLKTNNSKNVSISCDSSRNSEVLSSEIRESESGSDSCNYKLGFSWNKSKVSNTKNESSEQTIFSGKIKDSSKKLKVSDSKVEDPTEIIEVFNSSDNSSKAKDFNSKSKDSSKISGVSTSKNDSVTENVSNSKIKDTSKESKVSNCKIEDPTEIIEVLNSSDGSSKAKDFNSKIKDTSKKPKVSNCKIEDPTEIIEVLNSSDGSSKAKDFNSKIKDTSKKTKVSNCKIEDPTEIIEVLNSSDGSSKAKDFNIKSKDSSKKSEVSVSKNVPFVFDSKIQDSTKKLEGSNSRIEDSSNMGETSHSKNESLKAIVSNGKNESSKASNSKTKDFSRKSNVCRSSTKDSSKNVEVSNSRINNTSIKPEVSVGDSFLYADVSCASSNPVKDNSKSDFKKSGDSVDLRLTSQNVDISIDDVFLMRPRSEDEQSMVLAAESDQSEASRSKLSTIEKNTSKSSHLSSVPGRSQNRNGADNRSGINSNSMDVSEFGASIDDPSSDSSRLVIDEDVSGRASSFMGSGIPRNQRIASLIKSDCATSTPRSKSARSSSAATPLKSLIATMSPIPSRKDEAESTTSPIMDFDDVNEVRIKEEPVEVPKSANLTYTLEEDVIVLSDDGEDFPNSQLFDDERKSSSRTEVSDEEDNVPEPPPPAEEEQERIPSPPLDDSDSDTDSIDMIWVAKLSQSQSFVKTEPEDMPEPVPEPVPEDFGTGDNSTSVQDTRRESIDSFEPVPSVSAPSHSGTGSRRLFTGPEVIDAPPMPRRRAHLRGISVETANFLHQTNRSKGRSRSADRSRKDKPKVEPVSKRKENETSRLKASAKEERKARLKEICERKKTDTSVEQKARSNKKGTAKIKVTDKLRGSFLTEMSDSVEVGKRTKVPTRQSVLQMKQIPKLKHAEPSTSRSISPLENLNMSFDRYKNQRNGVPVVEAGPSAAAHKPVVKPMAQIAPRVAEPEGIPEYLMARWHQPSASPSDRIVRSCLRKTAVYMTGIPKKHVRFREDCLVQVREIEALETTKPFTHCKDAPIPSHSLPVRQQRARGPDLSIDGVLKDIFQWKTKWLDEYLHFKDTNPQNMPDDPPAQGARPLSKLPYEFVSYDEYFDKMYPLLLVELWNGVVREWEILRDRQRPRTHHVCIDNVNDTSSILQVSCHAVYNVEHECPKMGDLVVCEFVAIPASVAPGNTPANARAKACVIDAFGYISSESRERQVRGANEMLLIKNPSARNLIRLTVQLKNRNVQLVKDKLMLMKVVKYIRPDLRYFQALKYFKTLPIRPSILSPKADSSAFDIPPASFSAQKELVIKENLNPSQQEAILRTTEACFMKEPKICAIQGPPGTGKSRVTACLVIQLLYSKHHEKKTCPRILLCAPSNAAVDVLVMRLLEERQCMERDKRFRMVRVGRLETMHPKVRDISLQELAKRDVLNQANSDTSSVETDLRMAEAKLRAFENAQKTSRGSRGSHYGEDSKELRELKRKVSVLQSRLEQSKIAAAQRAPEIRPGAERESCKKLLSKADIVATTLSSCFTKLMETIFPPCSNENYNFTCCIIDEATQCMEVQTLMPLMLGVKTLVLVGDPKQLPATVLSQNARNCGLGTSLFRRMLSCLPEAVQFLNTQYRMHPDIISWPNRYFYNRRLHSPEELAEARVSPLVPYAVIRTPFLQDHRKEVNSEEAKFVINLAVVIVNKLIDLLCSKEHNVSVGIITPYQKQKHVLNVLLHERCQKNQRLKDIIEINTFDSFQGQEKDVVIMSCVRTDKIGFLNDPQRLNVALTRAKFSLLICGNFGALYGDEMWNNLLQDAERRKLIKDVRGRPGDRELWSLVAAEGV